MSYGRVQGPGRRDPERREAMFTRHAHVCALGKTMGVRCAKIPQAIYEMVKSKDIRPLKQAMNYDGEISESKYFEPLKNLLLTEEAHQAVEMRKHDKTACEIQVRENELTNQDDFEIELKGQAENSLLDISDGVLLEDPSNGEKLLVRIKRFRGDWVQLKNQDFQRTFLDTKLNVYFISSGIAFKACQAALEEFSHSAQKKRIIFESQAELSGGGGEPMIDVHANIACDLLADPADKRLDELNVEQRQAVIGILEAKCRPKPYILFGPPGTGKTYTLVQAVVQIYLRSARKRVLFCANSNTCVDQIFKKLKDTDVFADRDLVRLRPGTFIDSSAAERVVVTTNIKSCNLITGPKFDYVFIDEAGHANEPESLVPCCSLAYDGCLVLAGDPEQLGPVVQFEEAGKNGLGSSMLARLFKWSIYKRKRESGTNNYDPRYLTKLLDCYRCDPRILAISNVLFYDNELRCLSSTPKSLMKMMNLESPVQMISCERGEEFQPQTSTSYKNETEMRMCIDIVIRLYKMGFGADQIGIMSPYKLQVREMRKELKNQLERSVYARFLDERFKTKVKQVRMVPKDEEAKAAQARNEIREDRRRLKEIGLYDDGSDSDDDPYERVEMIQVVEWVRHENDWKCKIDTVDSFQGNEREVIIFSPVRTQPRTSLGFLDDRRRFNVAMSRAKWLLIVVGKEAVLRPSRYWQQMLLNSESNLQNLPSQSVLDDPCRQNRRLF